MIKRFLAVIMSILMVSLCCSVGLADNDEKTGDKGPITKFITGTYNGYSFMLDARNSSSSLIKATGTYGTTASLTLKFDPVFGYYSDLGYLITYDHSCQQEIVYGPSSTTSITKSYTVSQAVTASNAYLVNSSMSSFVSCLYKLKIGSSYETPLNVTYMS